MDVPVCRICRLAQAERQVELTADDGIVGQAFVCEPCWEVSMTGFERARRRFAAYLNAGFTREEANDAMCRDIHNGTATKPLVAVKDRSDGQ